MSASALYEGWVRHRRRAPVDHAFRYRAFMLLLDLDELPGVLDSHPLWSARRPAPARFAREDYLGDPAVPLADAARDAVEEHTGRRPDGPVRLLTQVRYLGRVFNPVSFYFCFAGDQVDAVVAEVTNTPWGERHAYVLERGEDEGRVLREHMDKAFHVSPFLGMDQGYDWRVTEPHEELVVHIENREHGRPVFDATLSLHRRGPLDRAALSRVLLRYPPMSLAVPARIYLHALRLKLKGAPYHPHPGGAA